MTDMSRAGLGPVRSGDYAGSWVCLGQPYPHLRDGGWADGPVWAGAGPYHHRRRTELTDSRVEDQDTIGIVPRLVSTYPVTAGPPQVVASPNTQNERGTFLDQILSDIDTYVAPLIDILALVQPEFYIAAAAISLIEAGQEFADGDDLQGVFSVAESAGQGLGGFAYLNQGNATAAFLTQIASYVNDGTQFAQGVDGVVNGIDTGNIFGGITSGLEALAAIGGGLEELGGITIATTIGGVPLIEDAGLSDPTLTQLGKDLADGATIALGAAELGDGLYTGDILTSVNGFFLGLGGYAAVQGDTEAQKFALLGEALGSTVQEAVAAANTGELADIFSALNALVVSGVDYNQYYGTVGGGGLSGVIAGFSVTESLISSGIITLEQDTVDAADYVGSLAVEFGQEIVKTTDELMDNLGSLAVEVFGPLTANTLTTVQLGMIQQMIGLESQFKGEQIAGPPQPINPYGYIPEAGDAILLARLIYAEADSTTKQAMTDVGWSIVNRIGNSGEGFYSGSSSLSAVVYHSGGFQAVDDNKINWIEGGDPTSLTGANAVSYLQAQNVANGILNGAISDPTGGATFFYNGTPTAKNDLSFFYFGEKSGRLVQIGPPIDGMTFDRLAGQ